MTDNAVENDGFEDKYASLLHENIAAYYEQPHVRAAFDAFNQLPKDGSANPARVADLVGTLVPFRNLNSPLNKKPMFGESAVAAVDALAQHITDEDEQLMVQKAFKSYDALERFLGYLAARAIKGALSHRAQIFVAIYLCGREALPSPPRGRRTTKNQMRDEFIVQAGWFIGKLGFKKYRNPTSTSPSVCDIIATARPA